MDSFRISLQGEYKLLQNEMKKHHIKIPNEKFLNQNKVASNTLFKNDSSSGSQQNPTSFEPASLLSFSNKSESSNFFHKFYQSKTSEIQLMNEAVFAVLDDNERFNEALSKSDLEILLKPIGLIVTVKDHKLYLR